MSSSVSLVSLKNIYNLWVKWVSSNDLSRGILKTFFRKLSFSFSLVPLFRCFAIFSFLFHRVLPIGTLSTSKGFAPTSEGVLTVFCGFSESLSLGLSALRRATSIFSICTWYVKGSRRSMDPGVFRSITVSWCRSMTVSECRSILT